MKITRLRLLGFKSFVEPTELLVEAGLTGVVGPNGCGKSNLLEALRWVMGETSHKSMRAAAMDDVIFSGTTGRPPRNFAEVTLFLDNSARLAPAEWNGSDEIEITRRIEREAGSAYRINGADARARDVKILFEDAATGARSPALVRQGQISEIVNSKPEHRRRVLEDAAGIAGLHSRRHEAELRLKGAENNLARLADIMGQITSQVESLKRQARHARRYKDLSEDIRRTEALLYHLIWREAEAQLAAEEASFTEALSLLATATEAESRALLEEAAAAEAIQPLREEETRRAAALARIKIEADTLDRDAERATERQRDLDTQAGLVEKDLTREKDLIGEAKDILANLETEAATLDRAAAEADVMEDHLHTTREDAEHALKVSEKRLAELTERAAEARARRRSLEAAEAERRQSLAKLDAELASLDRDAEAVSRQAPDSIKLMSLTDEGQRIASDITAIETATLEAEERAADLKIEAEASREAAARTRLSHAALVTERETVAKIVMPSNEDGLPPIEHALRVSPGYEAALGVALGDDLDAPIAEDAPVRWRRVEIGQNDPALPADAEPLSLHVGAPPELQRRLRQVGVIDRAAGARLQPLLAPGQRLVSLEGDLWRWDGFTATAGGMTPAAQRLSERNRLADLFAREERAQAEAKRTSLSAEEAAKTLATAEEVVRRLRASWRDLQSRASEARNALAAVERAARETETRLGAIKDARTRATLAQNETRALLDQVEDQLALLDQGEDAETLLVPAQKETAHLRTSLAMAVQRVADHERERAARKARLDAIAAEKTRWATRLEGADRQIAALEERLAKARAEAAAVADLLPAIEERRHSLQSTLATAIDARNEAADRLVAAEQAAKATVAALREAQSFVSTAREARARSETRLEQARSRREDEARRIAEALATPPENCLALAGLAPDAELPSLADADRTLQRLKADRERLGGVNLQADDELNVLLEQVSTMETERADVEQAVAKLRGAIAQLNREGKKRLEEAFEKVNAHFQRLFTTLFGGGEARLEMIEGEDPLAGGLEIIAKPPGKKPATLSLLSGGEQTLTALSLIFAIFLTNPSPICVLDEVDAPLDDANVDRFCTLMEKMASETATRFLVITHHPMTMTRMNRLFGVTMAEKGISQLVSVDLETARSFREAV